MNKNISLIACFVLFSLSASAWFDRSNWEPPHMSNNQGANRANCAPAAALSFLQLNNVRALIETGGSLWQDRATNNASYEVPKGSGNTAIYSGALWMGGTDVNGQLKIACVTFRQGNDFWPGPLTTDGTAEIGPETCLQYDQFFLVSRAEVALFNAWYECVLDDECDENEEYPGYQVPDIIQNWPAHGDVSLGQDFYLAPFYDRDQNGLYEWSQGDYPWYDLNKEAECGNDRVVRLFGDQTYWWVFNDKGNIHTETGGDPIGMEVKAQAFAFTTNDEVNNMTFYNYELINRSTQTLTNTYFGQWVDPDLGCSGDDYVGCDVQRGLGYCYNGDSNDDDVCSGALPYGANPPAIGVDFFEGPYQDNDGQDNPGPTVDNGFFVSYNQAIANDGITYKGMGIGYGDGVVDNERFGMRKFMYYTGGSTPAVYNFPQTDPNNAVEYYRYLQGLWQNGDPLVYGGGGYESNPGADANIPCDYAFPGDSDPLGFGAGGVGSLYDWSEATNSNPKGDRRFMQSAGPFTLEPGAVNNITVGVVYARAEGGLFASVEAVRLADDKAQALFDNCFEIVEGPDAPDVTVQELDRELILYLSNSATSNNPTEEFVVLDPFIITPDSLLAQGIQYDNLYRFEGYQIYQLKNEDISPSELNDIDKARLVAQCDIKNGVDQLVNWTFNEALGVPEPMEMVNGNDDGIKHSFKITEDLFAQGDRRLVNYKKYYYMAIAYSYNEYEEFSLDPSVVGGLLGQQKPYLASRKNGQGGEIRTYVGIPHKPAPEADGTIIQAEYGDSPEITRIEGEGNGGLVLDLTAASELEIVNNGKAAYPTYQIGAGPVNVKVIDPLNVVDANYRLIFNRNTNHPIVNQPTTTSYSLDSANWMLINLNTNDTVFSTQTIIRGVEQMIPEWGLSVEIEQVQYDNTVECYTELLEATIEYGDSSIQWLSGVEDTDGENDQNWIRSGALDPDDNPDPNTGCDPDFYRDELGIDDGEFYEGIIGGTWAPYRLCGIGKEGSSNNVCVLNMPISNDFAGSRTLPICKLQSVDIVFTSDKSKWTRCPVVEMQDDPNLAQGNADKMSLREAPSIDQNGNPDGTGNGMGWFPGYAIDLETGERLNMAYSEDSWLPADNGADMKWNPTNRLYTNLGQAIFGGKHYVYIFKNEDKEFGAGSDRMPAYDAGAYAYSKLTNASTGQRLKVWRSTIWVGMPMLAEGFDFDDPSQIPTDARLRFRVAKKYDVYATQGYLSDSTSLSTNNWNPVYEFNTANISTLVAQTDTGLSALDMVGIVPNPYYAYSQYEENRIDNRVKLINLPVNCTITIYTASGTLVRQFTKDDELTYYDWDLKNFKGIPIASGTYIIHIKAENLPDSGLDMNKRANERVIKFFAVMRPPDLDNF